MEKCEECGKEFETEAQLRGHMMQHKRWDKPSEQAETEVKQEVPAKRKERIPFGTPRIGLSRFNASMEGGYVYRIFNQNWRHDPDRIKRAKDAGYEIVNQEDVTVGTNEDGSAIKGILMRIPEEFYNQDQKAKQKVLDDIDAEIYRGRYQEQPGEKRYIPSSGIHVDVKSEP